MCVDGVASSVSGALGLGEKKNEKKTKCTFIKCNKNRLQGGIKYEMRRKMKIKTEKENIGKSKGRRRCRVEKKYEVIEIMGRCKG